MFSAGYNFLSKKTFSFKDNLGLVEKNQIITVKTSHFLCGKFHLIDPVMWFGSQIFEVSAVSDHTDECPPSDECWGIEAHSQVKEMRPLKCFSEWWPNHNNSNNVFYSAIDVSENWSRKKEQRFPKLITNPLNCSSSSANHSLTATYIQNWNVLKYT